MFKAIQSDRKRLEDSDKGFIDSSSDGPLFNDLYSEITKMNIRKANKMIYMLMKVTLISLA